MIQFAAPQNFFRFMKIKLLTQVAIAGVVRKIGDEVEVEKVVGKDLIHRKRAVSLDDPQPAQVINSDALAPEAPKRGRKKAVADTGGGDDADSTSDATE